MGVTPFRLARSEVLRGGNDRGPPRDVPGLARVGVEPRLKERLSREGFVGHGGEDPLHTGARRGAADPGQKTKRAVRSAGLLQRGEDDDDPFRTTPVIHQRAGPELPAVLLEKDAQAPIQADQTRQQARPTRHRTGGERDRKGRCHDPARIAERAREESRDPGQVERCRRSRRH